MRTANCEMPAAIGSACLRPTYVREDARGLFVEIVSTGPWETVVTGTMRAGAVLGRHYHRRTRALLFLTRGAARVEIADVATGDRHSARVAPHQGVYLEPDQAHAIHFEAESDFILLKSRRYTPDDPDTFPFDFGDGP